MVFKLETIGNATGEDSAHFGLQRGQKWFSRKSQAAYYENWEADFKTNMEIKNTMIFSNPKDKVTETEALGSQVYFKVAVIKLLW